MKKILFFLVLLCHFVQAQNLQSFLSVATFNTDQTPFLETYLAINANSLILINDDNKYNGETDVKIKITSDNEIIFNDHYVLKSPAFESESNNNVFFIDQQRILLKNGEYTLDLTVSDIQANFINTHSKKITIDYDSIWSISGRFRRDHLNSRDT